MPSSQETDAEVIAGAHPYLFPDGYDPEWMEGMLAARQLHGDDEGLWLTLIPLTYRRSRICVSEPGRWGNASIEHWCMSSYTDGLVGWLLYPQEPIGWNRHQHRDHTLEWADGRKELPDGTQVWPGDE